MKIIKTLSLIIMAGLYIVAGVFHFAHHASYLKMMPAYLGDDSNGIFSKSGLICISGLIEILLGILVLIPFTRKFAAISIIVMLISFFPVNIFLLSSHGNGLDVGMWFLWLRIPLQFVLMYWAWWYRK
jgi:uncharacterized membrane protein